LAIHCFGLGDVELVVVGLLAGLVPAEFLQEGAGVGAADIRRDDAEEGFLVGAHSAETNLDCHVVSLLCS
jgi:hypothetical protein